MGRRQGIHIVHYRRAAYFDRSIGTCSKRRAPSEIHVLVLGAGSGISSGW